MRRRQAQEREAIRAQSKERRAAIEDKIDPAANASSLRSALLPLLGDRRRLEAMQQASAGRDRAGAAEAIAQWLARG